MRYQPLPAAFHTANRHRLAESIGDDAIAVIDTAAVQYRNADSETPFRPDSNFYYLTGIDQPEAVLLLVPGSADAAFRELLFVRQTDDFLAQWEGERFSQAQAAELSGIRQVYWLDDLDAILDRLVGRYTTVYVNAEVSLNPETFSPALRRAHRWRRKLPFHTLRSVLPLLTEQRIIKAPVEIEQIRRAVALTAAGLEAAWRITEPGRYEYELEAELTAAAIRGGATGQAFHPIVAAGAGATVMHYVKNDAKLGPHDLVLFDTGAEAGWYASDISRVVPAAGHFTDRQRAVYEALWRVQQAGISLHRPGLSITEIDERMRELLTGKLVGLGLITAAQADHREDIPKFLQIPHSSHHLGLDVHDTGSARVELRPGMVVTCEPGLYLKDEGIGIRLEDDILITDDGHEVLSAAIPSAVDQIVVK